MCGSHFKKGSKLCPRHCYPFSTAKKKALSHLGKKQQNLGHGTRSSTAGGSEEKKPYPVSMRGDKKRRVSKVYSPYC